MSLSDTILSVKKLWETFVQEDPVFRDQISGGIFDFDRLFRILFFLKKITDFND
jgi:hypothetical protein